MSEAIGSYRAFREEANRLLQKGLRHVVRQDLLALARTLGPLPAETARVELRSLIETFDAADETTRFRQFFRTLASCFQAFQLEYPLPRLRLEELFPVSPQLLIQPLPRETRVTPRMLPRLSRFLAQTAVAQVVDVRKLGPAQLIPYLTHSDLGSAVTEQLIALENPRRLALAWELVGANNALLKKASLALTRGIPIQQRASFLFRALGERPTARAALGELLAAREAVGGLFESALTRADTPLRLQILRLMRRIRELEVPPILDELAADPDPELAFFARATLHALGVDQLPTLKEAAADQEHHARRIVAKLELILCGRLKERHLIGEFDADNQVAHVYAADALGELPNVSELVAPLLSGLTRSGDKGARLQAVQRLCLFDDPRFLDQLRDASRDPSPPVRRRAIARLIQLQGYTALEEFFDLEPLLTVDYDQLSYAQHQYILFHILPHLRFVPDCRFSHYLAKLVATSCEKGIEYDFEVNLKPILAAFAEAMLEELGELARSPNPFLSAVAEEQLLAINSPRAQDLVRSGRVSLPPLTVAYRNLRSRGLREEAVRDLAAAGPEATPILLPGLKERELREFVCAIFRETRDPAAVEPLLNYLGTAGEVSTDAEGQARPGFLEGPVSAALLAMGEAAIRPLRPFLANSDWSIRAHAVALLGRLADYGSKPKLRALVQDPHPEVALAAIEAVGELADDDAVPSLVTCLGSDNIRLSLAAGNALVAIGSPACVRALENAVARQRDLARRRPLQGALSRAAEQLEATRARQRPPPLGDRLRRLLKKARP